MSIVEKLKKMNVWKLGIMLAVFLFTASIAGSFIHIKASEFTLTEDEKNASMAIAEEFMKTLPPDSAINEPRVGWNLSTSDGPKRVTYVTIESEGVGAFIAVDLELNEAVTIVESRGWTKKTSIIPFRFMVNYAENPEREFFRNAGIIILILAVIGIIIFTIIKQW